MRKKLLITHLEEIGHESTGRRTRCPVVVGLQPRRVGELAAAELVNLTQPSDRLRQFTKRPGTASSSTGCESLADSVTEPLRQSGHRGEAVHVVIRRPGQTVHDIILRRIVEPRQSTGEDHGAVG